MRKLFLLSGLALFATGASAQICTINDVTVKPGEKGFFEFQVEELDPEVVGEVKTVEFRIAVPKGVTPGDAETVDLDGLVDYNSTNWDLKVYTVLDNDITFSLVSKKGLYCNEVEGFTLKVPFEVANDAVEGDYDLNPDDVNCDVTFYIGDDYDIANASLEVIPGTLTIGEGVAPLTYAAKIYEAAGVTVNMNVADAASLQSYLSSHKNAIAVFASAVPDEIAALDNVVVDGVAKSIVLTSQNEYPYTGEAFVAEKVSFEYWIGTKATKDGGWNSLAIPFTGTPEVEPFTTADMNSGKYWAKVYTGSNSEGLLFGNLASAQFEANKSYLVAFPGSDYGVNEFTSVTLNITAENEKVYPAANNKSGGAPYSMTTVYAGYTPASSYVLNAAGTKFEYKDAMQIAAPFTAFASAELGAPVLRSLAILDANQGITSAADAAVASTTVYGEDGEIVIIASEAGVASIVNMNGQVVKANVAYNEGETRVAIAAGAYVVAGQVVIVK